MVSATAGAARSATAPYNAARPAPFLRRPAPLPKPESWA